MKQLILSLALLFPLLSSAGPVNINTAEAQAIATELNGIGMAKAEAIVAYRNEFGAFETAEELVKVKGIGARVLDENRKNIKVSD
jgi:competence protein ComEA